MKTLRNNEGFSLVELMVVVAIIGVLAAISVGQVGKQIAKSRQSEAKTNLSSLYTSEKSLFAEFNSYGTNFAQMGLGYEGSLRYDVGFAGDTLILGVAQGYNGGAPRGGARASSICGTNGAFQNGCTIIRTNGAAPATPTGTTATGSRFTARASSLIYVNRAGTQDVWSINQDKRISNDNPGID